MLAQEWVDTHTRTNMAAGTWIQDDSKLREQHRIKKKVEKNPGWSMY